MAFLYLKGSELLPIIAGTAQTIKWLEPSGRLIGLLPANVAVSMVKAGTYIGKCSAIRCYYIREADERRPVIRDDYYRVDRAMLPAFSITSRTVDLWDKCFEAKAHAATEKETQK